MTATVVLPGGTEVAAASLADGGGQRVVVPDVGLYCDPRWRPAWPHTLIEWPDYELPANFVTAADAIRLAYKSAKSGTKVEVGCAGGLGRTGTVLACMAVLAGKKPQRAIEWVRSAYDSSAVETNEQEWWVKWFASDDLAIDFSSTSRSYHNPPLRPDADDRRFWCYFRSACQAVYREARHIAPQGHCTPPTKFAQARAMCAATSAILDSRDPWEQTEALEYPAEIVDVYARLTGLSLTDVLALFSVGDWDSGYGGDRWAAITKVVIELARAIDADDKSRCRSACSQLLDARHNNGPVVPPLREWETQVRLQRKWPCLCDCAQMKRG
jgi:hypothetical protein